MSDIYNDAGEPMMTASELAFEAYLDDEAFRDALEDRYDMWDRAADDYPEDEDG